MADKILIQLSIFVNNTPDRLAAVAETLRDCGINMKACNLAESTEFGILRAIVDDPDAAAEKLAGKGIIARKTEIVGVKIGDVPGSLYEPAHVLGEAGINIEYGYAFTGKEVEGLLIRVDDPRKAIEAFERAGLEVIDRSEI